MARYAMVSSDNICINLIEWDGESDLVGMDSYRFFKADDYKWAQMGSEYIESSDKFRPTYTPEGKVWDDEADNFIDISATEEDSVQIEAPTE